MSSVACDQQPACPPASCKRRVERVDRPALDIGFFGRQPGFQLIPNRLRGGDFVRILIVENCNLPTPTPARTAAIGGRSLWVAVLDRMVAEFRLRPFQKHIDDKPAFVKS